MIELTEQELGQVGGGMGDSGSGLGPPIWA